MKAYIKVVKWLKLKVIKSILAIAAVACFSFTAVKTEETQQVAKSEQPVLYMEADPGGTGGWFCRNTTGI